MTTTAAEQLRRILHLIPRIADGRNHSIDDIAAQLGVARDVLLQDLASLTERFDEPGGFVEGVSLNWDDADLSVVTPHFHRPMRLTMRELSALELGLLVLRRERPVDEWAVIDRALERLRGAITKLPSNDLIDGTQHAELDAAGDEHLASIRRALGDRRKLRVRYRGGRDESATTRIICPYSLIFASGMWYVVAHCTEQSALRFFRLDRIESVEILDDRYEIPSDFSVDAVVVNGRMFHAESVTTMTVRYSPRIARWIAEREGKPLAADGSITLEHPVADTHWAMRHVLQYGSEAEVVGPPAMCEMVMRRLALMLGPTEAVD